MAEYTDKQLTCVDCNAGFVFTEGQQKFFAEKGFTNDPKRCDACRAAKKAKGGFLHKGWDQRGGGGGPPEMHSAVCAECGTACEVPFKPRGDRPVYCSGCFNQQRK